MIQFNYGQLPVRTVMVNDDPWFVAKDVCETLDIKNTTDAIRWIPSKHKAVVSIDTLGGNQRTSCVSETGLYLLIAGSRKLEAKMFMLWVCEEVLPSIRKTGSYSVPKADAVVDHTAALKMSIDNLTRVCLSQQIFAQKDAKIAQHTEPIANSLRFG